ncbi:hypothetical protein V6N11_043036 [Hibiscus sabdariffa]|uniref:Uncharacterized protein n=1 Tax=Hibiscus sabdariffa TaxID=183260 RepID=A0ABR2QY64_9ROSI
MGLGLERKVDWGEIGGVCNGKEYSKDSIKQSVGEINIYDGHGLELDNADVGVEEVDVNDSGFNVEEVKVDVDDGPNGSPGRTIAPGPTIVDAELIGAGGPSADVESTQAGPSADAESPMEPPPSQAGPSAAGVSGPTGVAGSTRLETDNVEVGEDDINEGRADDDDDDDEESDDDNDLSYKAKTEFESEDLRGEVWVTDDEDEELTQIFEKARRFKEKRAAGPVGNEDLRQNEDCNTFHGTEEREEDNAQDTDYLASDDVGSYETDSDGEVVSKKSTAIGV